jgi:hypothetical protein
MRIRSLDPVPAAVDDAIGLGQSTTSASGSTSTPAPGTTSSPAPANPHRDQVLSNERTFTRWANVYNRAGVYQDPATTTRRLTRLHYLTEDGFPEVYVLLRAHWDDRGREWIKLRIPSRPNGRTGWVQRSALSPFHLNHLLLVVNRERMRISLYRSGRLRWSGPVGVGARRTPTPAGHFWVRERFRIKNPASGYYPYAFGTADYSTLSDWPGGGVVGIHGPYYAPQSIPGHISHGCIRLRVADDARLATYLSLGTPIHVI